VVLKEPTIMRPRFLLLLSGVVLVAAAVAVGCSEDPLSGGSQNIRMTYTPSPSGSGRFDSASFVINRIQALPADPAEAALFGVGERITFRFEPYTANLVLETPSNYSDISLSAGTYNVTLIEFTPLALVDTNLAPPPYAACIDGISTIDAQSVTPDVPVALFRSPLDDLSGLTFTLSQGQTSLALTVNVPGLIA